MTANSTNGFAFQTGEWRVLHRKLKQRLVGSNDWFQFDGTCRAWAILGGNGNIGDNWLHDPNGAYAAAAVRRLDPETGVWSIWWVDSRFPGIDQPLHGTFKDGVGTFHSEDALNGKPIRVRFIWSKITSDSAQWEQAFSPDNGATWETNWVMTFERLALNNSKNQS
jgi:hypothetical protein